MMISLQVLSCFRRAANVRRALELVAAELNKNLTKTQGRITKMEARVTSGIAGATAHISLAVDESDVRPKYIIWANELGGNEMVALARAQRKLNKQLEKIRGEVAGFYLKIITPLPRRTYVTLIISVNEEIPEKIEGLSMEERRARLLAVLRLVGNDPKAINLVQVAKAFGVSRDTLYKDLEKLGVNRQKGTIDPMTRRAM